LLFGRLVNHLGQPADIGPTWPACIELHASRFGPNKCKPVRFASSGGIRSGGSL
jgi:hypothetical protein